MADFQFEITKHIADLSKKKDWTMELNVVRWGENAPKFDVRSWSSDHKKMGKGITLTKDEALALAVAINKALSDGSEPLA